MDGIDVHLANNIPRIVPESQVFFFRIESHAITIKGKFLALFANGIAILIKDINLAIARSGNDASFGFLCSNREVPGKGITDGQGTYPGLVAYDALPLAIAAAGRKQVQATIARGGHHLWLAIIVYIRHENTCYPVFDVLRP